MKLMLRMGLCSPELGARLAGDPVLAKAMQPEPNAAVGFLFKKFFDSSAGILERVLDHAGRERFSFLRHLQFSPSELDAASHLEVICKATIGQTRADSDATRADYDADSLHPTQSRWPVRLPGRIHLTKPVPSHTISHVDQWTGEYVLGAEAARLLTASGLTGFELRPVYHPRTKAVHDAGLHLVTRNLLPPVADDPTWFESHDDGPREPTTPRRRGLLVYPAAALEGTTDFARTAEPWGEWRTPIWIVKQPVRQWFTQAELRGWAFWPVLVEGTPLHEEHSRLWREAMNKVAGSAATLGF